MQLILIIVALAVFLSLLLRFRRSPVIYFLAAASWVGAYIWNLMILKSCTGDCNTRVDLVLIVPLVLLATGFALAQLWRRNRHHE